MYNLTQSLLDTNLFERIIAIKNTLVPSSKTRPSCTAALVWCSENKVALRKIGSSLEFELLLQEYIELTRIRSMENLMKAIIYARKFITPWLYPTETDQATHKHAIHAMGLLAINGSNSCYKVSI